MRLGVFLPNWIGDVVMATPAIRALRKLVGEEGQLIGVMRPYVSEVLAGTNWLDAEILYDKPSSRFRMANRDVYQKLRSARLDRVVLLTNSLRTAWIAWRSGARQRIGFVGDARAWLLTQRVGGGRRAKGLGPEFFRFLWPSAVRPRPSAIATIDGYLRLAEAVGCPSAVSSGVAAATVAEPPSLELATTSADERAADDVWQQLRLPPGNEVVILNSGGAYGAAKQWPAEYFADLARRIVGRRGEKLSVLVNCGPAEREIAAEITARAADPRVVTLASFEQLPIGLTKACVRRARMVVTTDSGPRFLAVAFGKPVVTLFGPTGPAATATGFEHESYLSLALECQPCMARTCPLVHHRCMRDLTVDRVYAAVAKLLAVSC